MLVKTSKREKKPPHHTWYRLETSLPCGVVDMAAAGNGTTQAPKGDVILKNQLITSQGFEKTDQSKKYCYVAKPS